MMQRQNRMKMAAADATSLLPGSRSTYVILLIRPTRIMRIAPPMAPPAMLPTQPSTAEPATAPIS